MTGSTGTPWHIIYLHGIGDQLPKEALKLKWDKALFGQSTNFTSLAYWADRRSKAPVGLTALDLIPNKSPLDPVFDMTVRLVTRDLIHDVNSYLYDPVIRANILNVVYPVFKEVQDQNLIVIGHSLGSVIAYEALLDLKIKAKAFITLGSPLGVDPLRAALRILRKENVLAVPDVEMWNNYSDPDDIVALDHTLKNDFNNSPIITDYIVKNLDRANPTRFGFHSGTGYLALPAVKNFIAGVING